MNTMGGKESQLLTMLEPTVEMLGFALWGLELLSPNRRPTLRVYRVSPSMIAPRRVAT
jgi:ribosome maturation factor RimP